MKGKATSFDIAHHAGVSQSTVSRALRNSPLVNEETRARIHAIAKELNYKVDKNASNLRSQQSGTIALLLFQDPTSDDSQINPFFLSMLGSITRACTQKGYDLLVSFQELEDDWHADYEDCHKADGIILLGYGDYTDYEEKLIQLESQGTHFVRWGAVKEGQPGISIGCDNFQGGFDVTQHLIQSGRKNIAFIGGASKHCPEFFDRYNGSCHAIEKAGLKVNAKLQIEAITTEQSGYAAALQLLALKQPFDAVFCASDLIAIGVVKALRERGMEIPTDIAVVGYDNIPLSEFIRPTLTTVQQDTKLAGEVLVETLLDRINEKQVETTMLPAKLIVRESCGGKN
ncbi:LacI family DNA-binding transcriptional regulator [Aliikangiella coralliicola]|uniref:LacI family transcriptional regulator n=1 Tax=Aliikangiella coralliicola TaxID=2592383 RepID=A0A545UJP1_9GAMM|nr:LacI family DNA-binding transcriptional regulator [Aliikangiella coralliicola]TQV89685.1 LacI family transcriptional regulator [Aliikangiella coralliicola]